MTVKDLVITVRKSDAFRLVSLLEKETPISNIVAHRNDCRLVEPCESAKKGTPKPSPMALAKMQKESSTEEPTLKVDPGFEPGLTEVLKVSKSGTIVRIRND